ncbi:MAG: hypothetical protein HF982_02205 [Desulfobacteraceae bacterium]|nr:hypothetical protein [Desulfobacteraceae bacterium]MBC2718406.1 hypothetical protein [Desulfobacteraceae bacterium]
MIKIHGDFSDFGAIFSISKACCTRIWPAASAFAGNCGSSHFFSMPSSDIADRDCFPFLNNYPELLLDGDKKDWPSKRSIMDFTASSWYC